MDLWNIYLIGLGVVLVAMTALWLISLQLKDASIVDIFWGPGFVLAAGVYFALTPAGALPRKALVLALAAVWGLRLGGHIFLRNRGKGEDFRYQAWRREHGARWWWRSLLQVFWLQGGLMWLISAPLLAAQLPGTPAGLGALDVLGVLAWAVGFFFEAVGDWQLGRFKADPANKGQVMDRGLWRYTRHPNYFGDAAQWWGFFLLAAAAGGWWTVYAPALMTFLLMRVSGVTLLEKTLERRPAYREYIRRTSAFIPWFPRE